MAIMRERDVMAGVEEALPGKQIVAVALAFPPGTTRAEAGGSLVGEGIGAAAGALQGLANISSGASLGGGVGFFMAERHLNAASNAPAYVLALTGTELYILGKHRVQPLASNKDLTLLDTIAVSDLSVTHAHHGIVTDVTFTDNKTGQSVSVECKALMSGIGDFLDALQSEEVPVQG